MITFFGSLHSVRFDKDGEATVTVKVPLSDRDHILELAKKTEQALLITVDTKDD